MLASNFTWAPENSVPVAQSHAPTWKSTFTLTTPPERRNPNRETATHRRGCVRGARAPRPLATAPGLPDGRASQEGAWFKVWTSATRAPVTMTWIRSPAPRGVLSSGWLRHAPPPLWAMMLSR